MSTVEGVNEEMRRRAARVVADLLAEEIKTSGRPDPSDLEMMQLLGAAHDLWRELDERAEGTLRFFYDPDSETLNIEGAAYATDLFKALGFSGLAVGSRLEIVKRQDGAVWLRSLPSAEASPDATLQAAYREGFHAASEAAAEHHALDDASDLEGSHVDLCERCRAPGAATSTSGRSDEATPARALEETA